MNKYLLLILINSPLIILAILMALTSYKTGRSTKRRCRVLVVFWLLVGAGMVFVEPIYDLLVRQNLTDSPPLSVFDIILLAGLIFQMLIMVQLYDRLNGLSRKVSRMHEGMAIIEESRVKIRGSVSNAERLEGLAPRHEVSAGVGSRAWPAASWSAAPGDVRSVR